MIHDMLWYITCLQFFIEGEDFVTTENKCNSNHKKVSITWVRTIYLLTLMHSSYIGNLHFTHYTSKFATFLEYEDLGSFSVFH